MFFMPLNKSLIAQPCQVNMAEYCPLSLLHDYGPCLPPDPVQVKKKQLDDFHPY